jgi:hypothetical protein
MLQDVNTYNIKRLRELAKENKLKISGKKGELVERLQKTFSAIIVQKVFRGSLIRCIYNKSFFKKSVRVLCVNETDFYTMEPLYEIHDILFYTISNISKTTPDLNLDNSEEKQEKEKEKEQDPIIYGFNIESLVQLIYKTPERKRVKNPYTRAEFSNRELDSIRFRYMLLQKYFTRHIDTSLAILLSNTNTNAYTHQARDIRPSAALRRSFIANLEIIRSGSVQQRIHGVFMEMDSLGNYTDFSWFENMATSREFRRFYRVLYNIWFHHARMPIDVRRRICILGDPFENILGFIQELDVTIIREKCVRVMENMIFCGQDADDRRLGAFHVLTALTVVSIRARIAMPWLYESLF